MGAIDVLWDKHFINSFILTIWLSYCLVTKKLIVVLGLYFKDLLIHWTAPFVDIFSL